MALAFILGVVISYICKSCRLKRGSNIIPSDTENGEVQARNTDLAGTTFENHYVAINGSALNQLTIQDNNAIRVTHIMTNSTLRT